MNFYKYLKIRGPSGTIIPMENPWEYSKKVLSSEWHKNLMTQYPNEGQRQTGRTTLLLYLALVDASNGHDVAFMVHNHNMRTSCCERLLFWLEQLPFTIEKINGERIKIKTIDGDGSINFIPTMDPIKEIQGYDFHCVYIDNVFDDMGWR